MTMKPTAMMTLAATLIALPAARAQKGTLDFPKQPATPPPPPPPAVYEVDPPPAPLPPAPGEPKIYVYEQKPAAARQPLVSPDLAQSIIDRFKDAYAKMGRRSEERRVGKE